MFMATSLIQWGLILAEMFLKLDAGQPDEAGKTVVRR
jgi:hypothetical protein